MPASSTVPVNGMGIHREGYFLIRLRGIRYHILPLAVSEHRVGEHTFLRMATLAIRDWIPIPSMAIRREDGEKSIYIPIEQDIIVPADFILWNDGIVEVKIYGRMTYKARLNMLRFWHSLIDYALNRSVTLHSFAEVLSQEHCVKYLLNILNSQGMITMLNVKLKNKNAYVVAYGEKKLELYPSIARGEVSYDELAELFNSRDIWQLMFEKGELTKVTVRILTNESDRELYRTLLNELSSAEHRRHEALLAMLYSLTRAYITIHLLTGTIKMHRLPLSSTSFLDRIHKAELEVHSLLNDMFSYATKTLVISLYEEIYDELRSVVSAHE